MIDACLCQDKRYTFKSFKHEVDCLAASLLDMGFEKNDRVAVWLPNTSENVAMTFAASKLGLIKVSRLTSISIATIIDHRSTSIPPTSVAS